MEKLIQIRGHHILCLLGFRGLGYSEAFVENLARIHKLVFTRNCRIQVIASPDYICAACPRLSDAEDLCDGSRVGEKDLTVLNLLALSPGEILSSAELYEGVRRTISPESLLLICRNCRWLDLGYCKEGVLRLKKVETE